jgi:hypothetical protein
VIRTNIRERAAIEIERAQNTLQQLQTEIEDDGLSERERRTKDDRIKALQERIRELEQKRQY